jgi:hypothetical protein
MIAKPDDFIIKGPWPTIRPLDTKCLAWMNGPDFGTRFLDSHCMRQNRFACKIVRTGFHETISV